MRQRSIRRALSLLLGGLRRAAGALASVLNQVTLLATWLKFRLEFDARREDIFVVTYPRSGTTWMQMILYQLATDGEMAFDHISQVVPYFERMMRSGRDPNAMASPRLFKSHLPWSGRLGGDALRGIPKSGARYIYVVRNPADVAVSYYHFHRTHLQYQGSFEGFLRDFIAGKVMMGSWFRHVSGWCRQAHKENVLVLRYEDLAQDLEGSVRRIAQFCKLDVPAAAWPRILERCSFRFMKEHESQFDHLTEMLVERGQKLHAFLRAGRIGEGCDRLTAEQAAAIKQEADLWRVSKYVV